MTVIESSVAAVTPAMWFFVAVLASGVGPAATVLVRGAAGRAQSILAERLARGELSPDEYRERVALIGAPSRSIGLLVPVGVSLIVLGLVGAVAAAGSPWAAARWAG